MKSEQRVSPRGGRSSRNGAAELDYQALAEMRHQIRRFLIFSEGAARSAGIEPQQHQLLLAVKGLPTGLRPTVKVVAERLLLKHHTVVGLADRLVQAELLERRQSESDRREILLHITEKGERMLRKLSLAHADELRSAGPALARALFDVLTPSGSPP